MNDEQDNFELKNLINYFFQELTDSLPASDVGNNINSESTTIKNYTIQGINGSAYKYLVIKAQYGAIATEVFRKVDSD